MMRELGSEPGMKAIIIGGGTGGLAAAFSARWL
jgi:succinate dehydrogenase/fumarate reductase flavoprotein subunit